MTTALAYASDETATTLSSHDEAEDNAAPPGYKRTELGVIPEDWGVVALGDIGSFKNGINKNKEAFGHGFPLINLMDVFGTNKISSTKGLELIDSSDSERKNYSLEKGDVLFIRSSVKPSGVGLTAVIQENLRETVFSGFLIRFRDNGGINTDYKKHCFYEGAFRERVINASTVSANTNINQDNLKRILLVLPPTREEQEAIAQALSDVDALIGSLEQLITKKRHLKQGTMQHLLTPKPHWVERKVGYFANCAAGGTPSTLVPEYWNGNIRWMSSGELNHKYVKEVEGRITEEGLANSAAKVIPPNSVLIGLAGQGKTRGTVAINEVALCTNQSIAAILPNGEYSSRYLYYNLDSRYDELRSLSTGDGGRGGLNLGIIRSIGIDFPPLKEQTEIATILSDMDAEIEALEKKLAKTRQLKSGMMRELLTGRIRLI